MLKSSFLEQILKKSLNISRLVCISAFTQNLKRKKISVKIGFKIFGPTLIWVYYKLFIYCTHPKAYIKALKLIMTIFL